MTKDEWRPVLGLENQYMVNRVGEIYSLHRNRLIKLQTHKLGYKIWTARINGKRISAKVHTAVIESFIGSTPPGKVVCHNNGDPSDNRLENLRFDAQSSNMKDMYLHGRKPMSGSKNPFSKLNEQLVLEIKSRFKEGESGVSIARNLGVGSTAIYDILKGRTWLDKD